jgi:hypothetical protein
MTIENLYKGQTFSKHFILACIVTFTITVFAISVLQQSLPCVDHNGCFKDHCTLSMFKTDYQTLIRKSHKNSGLCRPNS